MTEPAIRILIATPSRDGRTPMRFTMSVAATQTALLRRGIGAGFFALLNDSLPSARNRVIATFMQTNCTHLLMVDDDMCWEPEGVTQLLEHGLPFVAGAYPRKDEPGHPLRWAMDIPAPLERRGPLVRATGVGMGFTLVTRECIEKMIKCFSFLEYEDSHLNVPHYGLFDVEIAAGTITSEDYVFCRRWREIKGEIWVDSRVKLGHIGERVWEADLAVHLLQEHPDETKVSAA